MTMPLKLWCAEEATRLSVSPITIYHRIYRGDYPMLPLIKVNRRRVFVDLEKQFDWMGEGSFTEGTL